MSMRDYAVEDFGLVLSNDTLKFIAEKLYANEYKEFSNPKSAFEADYNKDPYGFIEGVEDELSFCSYGAFTGEAFKMGDNGNPDSYDSISYSDDNVYYLPLERYPTLFSAAYTSFDEIVNELKEKIGACLPENFDYRNNIRMISGIYFG